MAFPDEVHSPPQCQKTGLFFNHSPRKPCVTLEVGLLLKGREGRHFIKHTILYFFLMNQYLNEHCARLSF